MKAKEKQLLHEKTLVELTSLLSQLREDIANLKLGVNKSKNVHAVYYKRKEIAQVMTVLRAKELSALSQKESVNDA